MILKKNSEKNSSGNPSASTRVVALIPARGGSKSIPLKNIKLFCDKPLIYWALKAAVECTKIDKVYIATEDHRIKEIIESFSLPKVSVIPRGKETATDGASTESVMLDFSGKVAFDHIILIQATSPLLVSDDITGGLEKYFLEKADSLLTVVRQRRFLWACKDENAYPLNYDPRQRPRRQDWDGFLVENGAFYITSRQNLLNSRCRISGKTVLYEMDEATYFEIDTESDWLIAEQLKAKKLQSSLDFGGIDFKNLNLLVCDVDGVLTDAGMYYSAQGDELKKFNTRDGKGIELIRKTGIKVMFLTTEDTPIITSRAKKLNIDYIFMGVKDKKVLLDSFFAQSDEFSYCRSAYIGDDLNDVESMCLARFSATPNDGCMQLKKKATYICKQKGGYGCVREVCDLIISRRI